MTAKVGPENGEVCGFVYLDAQIEQPGPICAVVVKKHDSGRTLSAAKQPASRGSVVTIPPGFISDLESWTTDLRKRLWRYQVSATGRVGDSPNNENKRYNERQCHHQ